MGTLFSVAFLFSRVHDAQSSKVTGKAGKSKAEILEKLVKVA